jgi:death-on-curing protein
MLLLGSARHSRNLPTNKRHYRVKLEDVLLAHEAALLYGGAPGVRDIALIESAIARPFSGYYRSIQHKSAALVHSLSLNHGFVDGNKRTALLVLILFVERSGYCFEAEDEEALNIELEDVILRIVEHTIEFMTLVEWMKSRIKRLPG